MHVDVKTAVKYDSGAQRRLRVGWRVEAAVMDGKSVQRRGKKRDKLKGYYVNKDMMT